MENQHQADELSASPSGSAPRVQCTTCRDIHAEDTRVEKWNRKQGWTDMCCPKCGGKSQWMILAKPIGRRTKARNSTEWRDSYQQNACNAGGHASETTA